LPLQSVLANAIYETYVWKVNPVGKSSTSFVKRNWCWVNPAPVLS